MAGGFDPAQANTKFPQLQALLQTLVAPSRTMNFDENYSLIDHNENMRSVSRRNKKTSLREDAMRAHFETLGFLHRDENAAANSIRHAWEVETVPADQLELPKKLLHAGKYRWIGRQNLDPPKWLWDSQESCTIRASESSLADGYTAVSYTWGRWKIGERMEAGTPWPIPILDPQCAFNLDKLKMIMKKMRCCRYFWVDVLCIDQSNPREREEEIAKQGAIFANAKAGLTYLWSLESGDELTCALRDIGKLLLRALVFANPSISELQYPLSEQELAMSNKLRTDPWFSSLWTLQEAIICPSSVWFANDGQFCKVNSNPITTAFFAAACFVLAETVVMRSVILASMDDKSDDDQELQRHLAEKELAKRMYPWRDWAEKNSSIVCSLSASRPAILLAAASRVATRRRGEAVLAAMKIADHDGFLGKDSKLVPGGLPIALVNSVLDAEGRLMFNVLHEHGDGEHFFADMLPTTADSCTQRLGIENFFGLPAQGWRIADNGFLHIPQGAVMQKFGIFSRSRVRISLQCSREGESTHETIGMSAKYYIESRYEQWKKERVSAVANIRGYLPDTIRVKFLPLAIHKTIKNAKNDKEFPDPSAVGLVLASAANSRKTGTSSIWYKCGDYVAYSYDAYKLDWKAGILIGRSNLGN